MSHYPINMTKYQNGFGLVMAIFILVVLGLLGGYMVRFSGVEHATSSYALQGARAYQAAKAGLGWAVAKLNAGGNCADINAQTSLSFPNIVGFTVSLSCVSSSYSEGSINPTVYKVNAHSEFGIYGGADYVSRELEMSMVK
jgi:MSHA biogenesis protein MshP